MKRTAVLTKIKAEAKRQRVSYREIELTNHTGVIVGTIKSTLKRHSEIDEVTAKKFLDQLAGVLGKGWWR